MKPIYATSPLSYLIQYLTRTQEPVEDAIELVAQLYSLNKKQTQLLGSQYRDWNRVDFRFSVRK